MENYNLKHMKRAADDDDRDQDLDAKKHCDDAMEPTTPTKRWQYIRSKKQLKSDQLIVHEYEPSLATALVFDRNPLWATLPTEMCCKILTHVQVPMVKCVIHDTDEFMYFPCDEMFQAKDGSYYCDQDCYDRATGEGASPIRLRFIFGNLGVVFNGDNLGVMFDGDNIPENGVNHHEILEARRLLENLRRAFGEQ